MHIKKNIIIILFFFGWWCFIDPTFKKILLCTYINNSYNRFKTLKEIKKSLNLKISLNRLKEMLILIYGNDLVNINNTYNINVSNKPIKDISFINQWNLYHENQIRKNYDLINKYFESNLLLADKSQKKELNKLIKNVSNDIIYYCLCSGVPENAISIILHLASIRPSSKDIKLLYHKKKKSFRKMNNKCSLCGGNHNLTVHHIKSQSKHYYLKYNVNNWVVLCAECHKNLHDGNINISDSELFYKRF